MITLSRLIVCLVDWKKFTEKQLIPGRSFSRLGVLVSRLTYLLGMRPVWMLH